MRLKLEATPDNLPDKVASDVALLDRILFEGDDPVKVRSCWWWLIRDNNGRAIAFAGLRACTYEVNQGLAYMLRVGVRAKHRGNGYQKKLIKARVALAKRKGFTEIITYVLNWNLPSANSLIACGFRLYDPAVKYAGNSALYFRKKLS
jgi:RimJ/RimL family protein N-acetyltransferase